MSVKTEDRIERKELLRESGMSTDDLYNWIKRGLLPHCCALYWNGNGGSTAYYPAWALERARSIKCLRSQGMSMPKVRKVLAEVVIKV